EFELATALGFDLGVFLTVVGVVLLALFQISRIEKRAEREPVPEGPMDVLLHSRGVHAPAARPVTKPAREA
ncbi:MAG TPA: hypothetical protein VK943_15965, partial [Arenibaculum sp.]|nr:hypothetical protein [Arenibaculum sp.]